MRTNPQTCHFLQGGRKSAKTNHQVQAIASLCNPQIVLRVRYIKTIKIQQPMLLNLCTLTCFIGLSRAYAFLSLQMRIQSTIKQQLKDLKALTNDGVLSSDEFLAQKEKLLKELSDL